MTRPAIPPNAYTYSPQQHPNLIIGSLQLLFWLVFRPSAWENHIKRLGPSLDKDAPLITLFRRSEDKRQARRFVIQGIVLLPILASLITGIISLSIGTPLIAMASGVAYSVGASMAFGVVGSVGVSMAFGVVLGVGVGMTYGMVGGVGVGMTYSVAFGVAIDVSVGKAVGVAIGMAFGVVVGVTNGVWVGVANGIAFGAGLLINWWRPVLMRMLVGPWHLLLYRLDEADLGRRHSRLHKHIAFWDEWQYLKIPGLEKHLLLVLERSLAEGQAALDYLSVGRQRWAAQSAQIELDARQLESCNNADSIGEISRTEFAGELTGPAETWFRTFARISTDAAAALSQASPYNQRLALTSVARQLNSLSRELSRSSDPYAPRFFPIAKRWYNIIELHINDLAKAAEQNQEIDSPYIIGVPLNEQQEIFVGRTDISLRIEQLLRDRRRPPLLLYGQRRTGKTSLLNNLGRLLPTNIVPLFVDLQGPASRASNPAGFLYNLAKGMSDSAKRQRDITFPPLSREVLADDPFTTFDEWLDTVETTLTDSTALLSLDEFEVLDKALTDGKFNESDVLGMLRNLIQQRPRFKVLIAGSHTLEEFQRWSSYLINAQVLHLSYLKEDEARQLIEQPYPGFALRYEPDASQRVIDVTRCHPFLVQLLCAEIVVLKNEQDPSMRRLATLSDVEAAIPEALDSGAMFFSDIERNQVEPQSLAVLRYIAAKGEGAVVSLDELKQQFSNDLEETTSLLIRRELLEEISENPSGSQANDLVRIQIELFRRWFIR